MAIRDCYTNYKSVDYNKSYDMIPERETIPEHLIDTDRFGIDQQDPISKMALPITNVKTLMFRFKPHEVSNSEDQQNDTLYYGTVTGDIELPLWGFETYLEFRDHLLIEDKATARLAWEELKCEIAGTHAKCLFWLPKMDMQDTRPGCWAITITYPTHRYALVWANGDYHLNNKMKVTKQNLIRI